MITASSLPDDGADMLELSDHEKDWLLAKEQARRVYVDLFTECSRQGLNGIRHDEWVRNNYREINNLHKAN